MSTGPEWYVKPARPYSGWWVANQWEGNVYWYPTYGDAKDLAWELNNS